MIDSFAFHPNLEPQKRKQQLQFNFLKVLDHDEKNDQVFCDFTVIIEFCRFQVHKCLIGIASDFFKKSITAEKKNTVTIYTIKGNVVPDDYVAFVILPLVFYNVQ